eukprot:1197149-Alexandrium_andersonii.AAC.1
MARRPRTAVLRGRACGWGQRQCVPPGGGAPPRPPPGSFSSSAAGGEFCGEGGQASLPAPWFPASGPRYP